MIGRTPQTSPMFSATPADDGGGSCWMVTTATLFFDDTTRTTKPLQLSGLGFEKLNFYAETIKTNKEQLY